MPAIIVFTGGSPGGKSERLRVSDDPATVVEKLGASTTGFADFSPASNDAQTFWINRDQVRMVRDAPEPGPGA